MSLTLGLTGMDPATETAFKATFVDANARLGGRWSLVPDAEANHVVVDMDSMYGPMSWLRLHASGRQVIGLTSAPRSQTDYRLGRPFDTGQLVVLLADIARDAGIELDGGAAPAPATEESRPAAAAPPPSVSEPAVAEDTPRREPAGGNRDADADMPQDATPVAPPAPTPPAPEAAPASATVAGPAAAADPEPGSEPAEPATTAAERTLATWLEPGVLHGQVRYVCSGGPALLIDAGAESWHGPATLKPLAACFEGLVEVADFEPMDTAAWAREAAAAGPAQPLSRLRWLGGLLAGGGALLPGFDPDGRFQLNKWPQTEREYPRHFRIATQMMKGPATVAEIAEASGVPVADVADFVNANLATGFAEPVQETPSPPADAAKARGGLLGRLRNR